MLRRAHPHFGVCLDTPTRWGLSRAVVIESGVPPSIQSEHGSCSENCAPVTKKRGRLGALLVTKFADSGEWSRCYRPNLGGSALSSPRSIFASILWTDAQDVFRGRRRPKSKKPKRLHADRKPQVPADGAALTQVQQAPSTAREPSSQTRQ